MIKLRRRTMDLRATNVRFEMRRLTRTFPKRLLSMKRNRIQCQETARAGFPLNRQILDFQNICFLRERIGTNGSACGKRRRTSLEASSDRRISVFFIGDGLPLVLIRTLFGSTSEIRRQAIGSSSERRAKRFFRFDFQGFRKPPDLTEAEARFKLRFEWQVRSGSLSVRRLSD